MAIFRNTLVCHNKIKKSVQPILSKTMMKPQARQSYYLLISFVQTTLRIIWSDSLYRYRSHSPFQLCVTGSLIKTDHLTDPGAEDLLHLLNQLTLTTK